MFNPPIVNRIAGLPKLIYPIPICDNVSVLLFN